MISLQKIESHHLKKVWEISYCDENPEWIKWDAPYLHKYMPLTWQEFQSQQAKFFQSHRTKGIFLNDEIIGAVTYTWENFEIKWLEVGLTIFVTDHWGKGYGTEALKQWVSEIWERERAIQSIGLTTWSANLRVIKASQRLGFIIEGRARKVIFFEGQYYDSIRMGILRDEWQQ